MPRRARTKSRSGIYHIIIRGNNKENIFKNEEDKKYIYKVIQEIMEEISPQIYAHCLMSNHLHLMMKIPFEEMSLFMNRLSATYAIYYNKKYQRSGHVFQGRFHSECIETESYFWRCLRYIHNNPVKVHLAAYPHQFAYSSAKEYYYNKFTLVSSSILSPYRKRFHNNKEFWEFHQQTETQLFMDVPEDMALFKKEIFSRLLNNFMKHNHLESLESLLADAKNKKKFIDLASQTLGISLNEANRMF